MYRRKVENSLKYGNVSVDKPLKVVYNFLDMIFCVLKSRHFRKVMRSGLMADSKKVVLTYEGLRNLAEDIENLTTVKRKEVAEKIKEARGQGDLSENAEYDAAQAEQGEIE